MSWLRDLPIKRKLMSINLLSLGVGLLLMIAMLAWVEQYQERQSLVQQIETLATVIGNRSAAAILFDDEDGARKNLQALAEVPAVVNACLFNQQRQVVAYTSRDGRLPDFCAAGSFEDRHWFERAHLNVVRSISRSGEEIGFIYVHSNLEALSEHLIAMFATFAGVFLLVILVMSLLGGYWQNIVSAPLERLAALARRVSQSHDYSVRAEKLGSDEVGQFVESFNNMLGTIEEQNLILRDSQALLEEAVEERTRELTLANTELEAFSYSVSHDLRAPVRAVLSFSQLVLADSGERLGEESREDLERVVAGARRMERLIDEMLNLARISRHQLNIVHVDISALAGDIMRELREQEPERKVESVIAPDLSCHCDAELARVVLSNLLANAWKYSSKTEQARIELGSQVMDGERVYFVADNGIGFDMQHAGQLFTPFSRLHRNDEYEGTGIGLATVYRVVQRHGGRIWVDATEGRGATFYFTCGGSEKTNE